MQNKFYNLSSILSDSEWVGAGRCSENFPKICSKLRSACKGFPLIWQNDEFLNKLFNEVIEYYSRRVFHS